MAKKKNTGDISWYVPNKKRPVMYSSTGEVKEVARLYDFFQDMRKVLIHITLNPKLGYSENSFKIAQLLVENKNYHPQLLHSKVKVCNIIGAKLLDLLIYNNITLEQMKQVRDDMKNNSFKWDWDFIKTLFLGYTFSFETSDIIKDFEDDIYGSCGIEALL